MSNDRQEQTEELLILTSILEHSITHIGQDQDQFEIDVEFQLPSPFILRFIDESHQLSNPIQHLPPLVLTVHFHEHYPSSIDPPTFVLSSCYLAQTQLIRMCQKLDKIWEENISQPIVYQWIECLKEELLNTHELCLSNTVDHIDEEHDDPRAMSTYDWEHAGRIYEQLLEYNRTKENEQFLLDYHTCPICLTTNVPGRDMIRLYKCHHAYCRSCLCEYARLHINTGSVEQLLCPDSQCSLGLLPLEVKMAVDNDALYEKYERLSLQKTLEKMQDIVWCPRCQQAVIAGGENDNLALCDQCRFAFCKKCKKTYHSQTLCGQELELLELQDRQRKLSGKLRAIGLTFQDEKKMIEDILAAARIESTTRLCPNVHCQVAIEKNMGCDNMYCTKCRTPFRWSEAPIKTSDIKILVEKYDADIDKVVKALRRQEAREPESEEASAEFASKISVTSVIVNRIKLCPNPNCKKPFVKLGSGNYIICDYCKRGFCFVCGGEVLNVQRHFQRGCKRFE